MKHAQIGGPSTRLAVFQQHPKVGRCCTARITVEIFKFWRGVHETSLNNQESIPLKESRGGLG